VHGWGRGLPFVAGLEWITRRVAAPLCRLDPATLSRWSLGLPDIWDMIIAECRLRPGDVRVDVMGTTVAHGRQRAALVGAATHQQFGRWGAVLNEWASARGALGSAPLLWFEWDRPHGEPVEPLMSIGLSPRLLVAPGATRPPRDPVAQAMVLAELGSALGLVDLAPAVAERIHAWVGATPPGWELLHVASLTPRGRRVLRLTVSIPAWCIVDWLGATRFSILTQRVRGLVAALHDPLARVSIQVELGPEPGSYFALETPEAYVGGPPAEVLLKPLRDAGAPVVRGAAAAIEGALVRGQLETDDGSVDVLGTCYLKFVLLPDERIEAKAYLGVVPCGGPRG
jgi:hypothetical protein